MRDLKCGSGGLYVEYEDELTVVNGFLALKVVHTEFELGVDDRDHALNELGFEVELTVVNELCALKAMCTEVELDVDDRDFALNELGCPRATPAIICVGFSCARMSATPCSSGDCCRVCSCSFGRSGSGILARFQASSPPANDEQQREWTSDAICRCGVFCGISHSSEYAD